ncbi:MAG TPA: hypothetical protein VK850_07865, partial [Candidatus Binatia bacterium]|nr:hypothetical protein [Candidatus Binatia bacterium]
MMKSYPPQSRGRQRWAKRAVVFFAMGVVCLSLAGKANAQLGARIEQASNGTPDAPISAVDWVNTTITAQRGHYVEGSSIPYRLVLDTVLPGTHRVVIAWDTQTSGRRVTDYL